MNIAQLNCKDLAEAIRDAKDEARRDCDFLEREGQAVAVNADGERCTDDGSPCFFFDAYPTLKDIKKSFERYPDAVLLNN